MDPIKKAEWIKQLQFYSGVNHWNFGGHLSDDTKQKIRVALTGDKNPSKNPKTVQKRKDTIAKKKLNKKLGILRLVNLPMPTIKNNQVSRKIFTGFIYKELNKTNLYEYTMSKKNYKKRPPEVIAKREATRARNKAEKQFHIRQAGELLNIILHQQ